jgi:hypothetical protein
MVRAAHFLGALQLVKLLENPMQVPWTNVPSGAYLATGASAR